MKVCSEFILNRRIHLKLRPGRCVHSSPASFHLDQSGAAESDWSTGHFCLRKAASVRMGSFTA